MVTSLSLKKAFTEFDQKKVKKVVTWIFIIEALLFAIFYFLNRDISRTILNQVPGAGVPEILFNIYGADDSPLQKPMAVTVANNKIYVSDTNNARVQIFDYDGNPIGKFGKFGTKKGEFKFPYGIAADSQGRIYVADLYNGNISVFSSDGEFSHYFGNTVDIVGPAGLFIDGSEIYITDVKLNKVLVFNTSGEKIREFGKEGIKIGEFRSPNAITVADNKVFVVDTGNDRVQVFNKIGQFIYQLAKVDEKSNQGNFLNPRGIGVDGKGTVFVVNNITNNIVAFKAANGEKMFAFGEKGNDVDQFMLPNGLFIDNQGRIYITDTVNQRVNVYQN